MGLLNKTSRFFLRHGVPPHPGRPVHELSADTLIAYGSKRECHRHPHDSARCIKVTRRPGHPDAQQPSVVEWYCATMLDRRGVSFMHRARCYGWVATDHGPGLVMERVRGADGQPSPTLHEYIHQQQPTIRQIAAMYAQLKSWVLDNAVALTDMNTGNVLVRHAGDQPYLVLVDGIGGQKVKFKFVLYRRLPWFARLLTRHRWPRLQKRAYKKVRKARKEIAAPRPSAVDTVQPLPVMTASPATKAHGLSPAPCMRFDNRPYLEHAVRHPTPPTASNHAPRSLRTSPVAAQPHR